MLNKIIYQIKTLFFNRTFFSLLIIAIFSFNTKAQSGAIDTTFNPTDLGFGHGDGVDGPINKIAIQGDGKIIVGGVFYSYNSTRAKSIFRLNTDGTIDNSFNSGYGVGYNIFSIEIQNDGKIIIGGDFTSYNETTRNRIARLNSNGTIDTTFISGAGADNSIYTTSIQNDGKIIIGGNFTSYNGTLTNRIARLNSNGTIDTTFLSCAGANDSINTISIQSNGKIIIGGNFTSYNGTSINRIARLNTDGTIDTTFVYGEGADNHIITTSIQNDGKIIIGGNFTSYNGTLTNRIARLNSNGTIDTTFLSDAGADNRINTISIQMDGKIIIGGDFISFNRTLKNRIARLNADGTLDTTFNSGKGSQNNIYSTPIQNDGKIIIGGYFYSYNGIPINSIARLNTDGTVDTSFNPSSGSNDEICTTSIQLDGKIIIGGFFTSYNGTSRNGIARLNTDGTLDTTFNYSARANSYVRKTAIQNDGKIIFCGNFTSYNEIISNQIARLNTDGTIDTSFNPGSSSNGDININTAAIQNDGKIIIGGSFTSYNGIIRNDIARLNIDGTIDTSFNSGTGTNGFIKTIAIQNDGKIIIGGEFTSYNQMARYYIARLNKNGTLDNSFKTSGLMFTVNTTTIQPNGKIIIGGNFFFNNQTLRGCIARLNVDGTLDSAFSQKKGVEGLQNVYSTAIQSNGNIIFSGDFTSDYSKRIIKIVSLDSDGSLDTTFNSNIGAESEINSIAMQSDGKIIIGGNFTSYNGTGRNRIARILKSNTVGVSQLQAEVGFSVFPNPILNMLTIEIEGNKNPSKVEIFNLTGQSVFKGTIDEKTKVNTSNFASGVYLVKIGNEIKKIIK